MATTRMRFALPYEPETQIGRAIGAISNAMFAGPTAYEVEAQQAARDSARATAALKTNELEGRGALSGLIDEYRANPKAAINDFATRLYSLAARYGYDPGNAAILHRGALAGPHATEQDRAYGTYVKDGGVTPFQSFGDLGAQRAAEGRQTAQKSTVAATGAAAANPDKYQIVAERKAILAGQAPNSPDRRVLAGFESRPGAAEGAARRAADAVGLDRTEQVQLDGLNEHIAKNYKGGAFSDKPVDLDLFKKNEPQAYQRWSELNAKRFSAVNRPNVPGFRPDPANPRAGTMPSQFPGANGRPIRVEKDPVSNKWYAHEVDGKIYPIEQ